MFTGIIEEIGKIQKIEKTPNNFNITFTAKKVLLDLQIGDSIAVNGLCLTVIAFSQNTFLADVMPVTIAKTNLKYAKMGDFVNLERAMQMQSRFGGHFVSGHIDAIGKILTIKKDENAIFFEINFSENIRHLVIKEGSISIDGISLTIADLQANSFIVSIIPHTISQTILQHKKVGDLVNLETDLIGKYLFNFQQNAQKNRSKITSNFLAKNGF